MKHVFILGSNGIPASYGGFETFVDRLVSYKRDNEIKYHVSCMANNKKEFEYKGAHCFNIDTPNIGPARTMYYDIKSIRYCYEYIKKNKVENAIVYMLGCGIGPIISHYIKRLRRVKARFFINPDGLEWKREKWHPLVRKYLKISEEFMVKNSDMIICDSLNIENYINEEYKKYKPNTMFIAYGADDIKSNLDKTSEKVLEWYKNNNIVINNYYLIVGRFVPENNYETMINEFIRSKTKKDLVIITNVKQNKFYEQLKEKTGFNTDKRIKFVGTVYDIELLKYIRENAYAYIHGHEVGGTNPSLLESLCSTKLNLLLNVGFNKEVAEDGGIYWSKKSGDLCSLINNSDLMHNDKILEYEEKAINRIIDYYNWENIIDKYEKIFLEVKN